MTNMCCLYKLQNQQNEKWFNSKETATTLKIKSTSRWGYYKSFVILTFPLPSTLHL